MGKLPMGRGEGLRPYCPRTVSYAKDMETVQLAERTMKARGESVCPRCRMMIHVGQRIGLVAEGWLHIRCVLGFRPPMIGWKTGA